MIMHLRLYSFQVISYHEFRIDRLDPNLFKRTIHFPHDLSSFHRSSRRTYWHVERIHERRIDFTR